MMGIRKERNNEAGIVDQDDSSLSTSSDLGIDNVVAMNIDKYLDDLEKTLQVATTAGSSSNGSNLQRSPSTSQTGTSNSTTGDDSKNATFGRKHRFSHRYSSNDDDPFGLPAAHLPKNMRSHLNSHPKFSHMNHLPQQHNNHRHQIKRKNHNNIASINIDESEIEEDASLASGESTPIQLIWRNLCYQAKSPSWYSSSGSRKNYRRNILEKQNGSINGGQITAIIGPSGAGKSTLLECLAGRRKTGLKGDIFVAFDKKTFNEPSGYGGSNNMIKIALIGQKDEAIGIMTVREVLEFASRIKNYRKISNSYYTPRLVSSVLEELNLEKCADVKTAKISGGQLKRLVFGVELISGPDIILLDEPTSGLVTYSGYFDTL